MTLALFNPGVTRYRCISMDPPWAEHGGGQCKRGADKHYPLMKYRDIEALVVGHLVDRVADDAHLWMWVTDNFLRDGLRLVDALGFRYIRTMCWFKSGGFGIGQYLRGKHELCLLAVRGDGRSLVQARNQPSAFEAERGKHSEKPARAYEIIEAVSPGPRLEMFARIPRAGWDVWGNEIAA